MTTIGTGTVTNTTMADDEAIVGAAIYQSDVTLTIAKTTFAGNQAAVEGGSLFGHTVTLLSATLTDNSGGMGGGLAGSAVLVNTLLARNTSMGLRSRSLWSPNCTGRVISLGTNLAGDPTGSTITLRATDRTGDPGAGEFASDGPPGRGHVPLLPNSQVIGAGNPAFCPSTDQLGQRRVGVCDIGAVEFQPPTPPLQAVAIDIQPRTSPIPPQRPVSRAHDKHRVLLKILKGEPFPPPLSQAPEPPPRRFPDKGCLLRTLNGEPCSNNGEGGNESQHR